MSYNIPKNLLDFNNDGEFSKQLSLDVDVSRLIADPDGAAVSTFVQLTGDSQWANNTYAHHFQTELAPNSQGPSNQVTGFFNQMVFRDSGHAGTTYWGMRNSILTQAPINFSSDKVYSFENSFTNAHYITISSGTEIAAMNCRQVWTFDPTVTGTPTLAGAVFNLNTGRLESAGYTHLRVNNAEAPTSGSSGPQFLYGLYIEEQTRASIAENNFTILTEGGRSSIKELDTDVFRIYNSFTDNSNYEALEIKWDTNIAFVSTVAAGTGTNRQLWLEGQGVTALKLTSAQVRVGTHLNPNDDSTITLGSTTKRWSNTFTDKITIGNGTDAILNGDGTGKIYMGNDSSQLTQFAVRGEDDGAGNYNQLELRMASNGACGLYSTGYGTQTPSGLSIHHNGTKTFEFTSTQLYIHKPFRPTTAGSEPLGTSSVPFGNLYISSSSKIYFNNAQLLGSAGGSGIVLEQRNGTTEQRYYLYNTYTDGSNYERLEMKWDTNVAYIENTNNGSGALRELYIGSSSQGNIRFGASGNIIRFSVGNFSATKMYLNSSGLTVYGDYLPQGNGTRSIGSDSARFKKAYINGMLSSTETFTATDTLDDQNQVCLCNATSGNITLNLPVASSSIAGTQYQIKKIDSSSNTVIITPNSGAGDLIDGSATYTLSNQWEGAIIVCDGADWFITGGVTNSGGGGGGGGGLGGGD